MRPSGYLCNMDAAFFNRGALSSCPSSPVDDLLCLMSGQNHVCSHFLSVICVPRDCSAGCLVISKRPQLVMDSG